MAEAVTVLTNNTGALVTGSVGGSSAAFGFHRILQAHLRDLRKSGDNFQGYIDERENYALFEEDLLKIGVKFITRTSVAAGKERAGKRADTYPRNRRILFESTRGITVSYTGEPFVVQRTYYKQCKFGEIRKSKTDKPQNQNFAPQKKPRPRIQNTKKKDCPAMMTVKIIKMYSDYAVPNSTKSAHKVRVAKKEMAKKLKHNLQQGVSVKHVTRYFIEVSSMDIHNHAFGAAANLGQEIDPRLIHKVTELVAEGVSTVSDMKIHLRNYVKHELLKGCTLIPDETNSSYYPSNTVIKAHMYKAKKAHKYDKLDQTNLEAMMNEWQKESPESKFLLRMYRHIAKPRNSAGGLEISHKCDQTFLWVHQEKWQQRLLAKYGSGICLLDATYRTASYGFPIYFLSVLTNTGYCVVAEFVVHSETSIHVSEALSVIHQWNCNWHPRYVLADHSEPEISAIERTLSSAKVYICAYHREQAWDKWCRKTGNVATDISCILHMWRQIADSDSQVKFDETVSRLYESDVWKSNSKLRQYFSNTWLSSKNRWVKCFLDRDFDIMFTSNSSIEAMNKVLVHSYLVHTTEKSLSGVLQIVIELYLPDMYREYVQNNIKYTSNYCQYSGNIPEFLHDRPRRIVTYILSRMDSAKDYTENDIAPVPGQEGVFQVKSQSAGGRWWHRVSFREPKCSCEDFSRHQLPCKHFCALFRLTAWNFECLPNWYRNNPMMIVDSELSDLETATNDYSVDAMEALVPDIVTNHEANPIIENGFDVMTADDHSNVSDVNDQTNCNLVMDLNPSNQATDVTEQQTQPPENLNLALLRCGVVLQEVSTITSMCQDMNIIKDVTKKLEECYHMLSQNIREQRRKLSGECDCQPKGTCEKCKTLSQKLPKKPQSQTQTLKVQCAKISIPGMNV